MPEIEDEGTDYSNLFQNAFATANTAERLRKERRANRTPKERSRGGKGPTRSTQINFRATTRTKRLLDEIAKKLDKSAADILEEAIEMMAKAQKVGVANA